MLHARVLVASLLGLVMAGSFVAALAVSMSDDGRTYTVAALRAHLARDPGAWLDRPLRVRAIALECSYLAHARPCIDAQPVLTDPAAGTERLPLAWGSAPPLVAFVRRLPLFGSVGPAPQRLRWNTLADYHVQVHALPCDSGEQPPCYEALLDDGS